MARAHRAHRGSMVGYQVRLCASETLNSKSMSMLSIARSSRVVFAALVLTANACSASGDSEFSPIIGDDSDSGQVSRESEELDEGAQDESSIDSMTTTTVSGEQATTTTEDLSSGAPDPGEDTWGSGVAAREYWIDDTPLALPLCDGSYISIVMSTSGEGASKYVRATPGASYLRTDITCPSLNPFFSSGSLRGQPIYSVFYGPFQSRYQAQQQCLDLGHTSKSNCYVAPLTSDEGDRSSRFGPLDP